MRYKVKFKITNCDSQLGHPQAIDQSFEDEIQCDDCKTAEEAHEKAHAIMAKRYPNCCIDCLHCDEAVNEETHGGCNVYDPAALKDQDTTEKKRL